MNTTNTSTNDVANRVDAAGIEIDPTWTVNDVIVRYPETVSVFNALGIDACCGGAKPLAEVARRHGLGDVAQLIATLRASLGRAS